MSYRSQRKPKNVYYKHASVLGDQTLQQMLETVLNKTSPWGKPSQRHQILNDDSLDCHVINHNSEYQGMLFCQLIYIEYGKSQSFLKLDENTDEYVISPLTTNDLQNEPEENTTDAQKEFIDSMLYFGVIDNHMAVIQSRGLTTKHLEHYLGWLLGSSCSALLPKDSALILKDTPTDTARALLEKSPVKSLSIGSPITSKPIHQEVNTSEQFEVKNVKFGVFGQGVNILKQIIGEKTLDGIRLNEALDDANLEVQVTVTYKGKTSECGQAALDTIAASMRHLDEDDFEIKLKSGGVIKGKELRIIGKLSVESINGRINESGLKIEMHRWLSNNAKPAG